MLKQHLEPAPIEELYRPSRKGEYLGQTTVAYTRADGVSFLLTYDRYAIEEGKEITVMRYQPNLIPP